ncbi:MAG: sugar transporter [Chlorobi bacterium]|nr:sugar transporter [Chlorobiota bacterium]
MSKNEHKVLNRAAPCITPQKIFSTVFFLTLIMSAMMFSGCQSGRNITYLKNLDKSENNKVFLNQNQPYKIKTNDILYVRVLSTNKDVAELYNNNPTHGVTTTLNSEADQYVNGFSVDKDGNIVLPVLGKLHVAGLTLDEAYEVIQDQANEFLINATVIVRLMNYKVTVIGEVKRPGVYSVYNNQVTVLEIIGRAGDITEFGDKKHILVIRPTEDGSKTYEIDLTDKSVLTNPGYYLMPNDVVYVKPIKGKAFRVNLPLWSLILSSLTTIIVLLQYFDNN